MGSFSIDFERDGFDCQLVFERMEKRNVWTWSAMILGLAQHGFAQEALELFNMMSEKSNNICPNYVTYLGVLCACSHAGKVEEGYRYFCDTKFVHGIKHLMVHYGAMVDVLGCAGLLREAYGFIQSIPIEPDPIVWRTLLSACTTVHDLHDRTGRGDKVRKRLLKMEPRRGGNLVIVANMYAEVGKWEKAANARRVIRDGGMKMAGESCVDLGGSMYRLFAGYDPRTDLIPVFHLLDGLNLHLKMVH